MKDFEIIKRLEEKNCLVCPCDVYLPDLQKGIKLKSINNKDFVDIFLDYLQRKSDNEKIVFVYFEYIKDANISKDVYTSVSDIISDIKEISNFNRHKYNINTIAETFFNLEDECRYRDFYLNCEPDDVLNVYIFTFQDSKYIYSKYLSGVESVKIARLSKYLKTLK